ncbi:multifunctional CCA protein [Novimethylophilus kurashikiensis]|uniref:Multifunctional CCA protein n=1 Tax=Novimethylophilus kurashikiensis TaxID=1825523 RepID=A0A2R5FAH2_9PROT|nr:AAA family ATPase [Novimethylophilus kurashikiensis]GBG14548.1 multifunctional CCA protein [Novimethylophilus kurashikiensis]
MLTYDALRQAVPAPNGQIAWGSLLPMLPDVAALSVVPQDPVFHAEGNVLIHTQMVCEALVTLKPYQEADADRRFVLFYAALLHDIAKWSCTITDEHGRIRSPGHSKRGAVDTRILLWRAGVPFTLRERICRIILQHQTPFFAIKGSRSGDSAEFIVRKLSWEVNLLELAAVAEADILGRVCDDNADVLVNIELFRELAMEEGCFESPRAFPDPHTRLTYFRTSGGIAPDYPFHQEPGSLVTVLAGLPASGKNTWVDKYGGGLPVISFDDAREELGLKHGTSAGAAVHLAVDRAKELLRKKASFIWNATNISHLMRTKCLDLLLAYGAEVTIVYLESPEHTIKQRNNKRDTTLTNAAIDKMLHRWEVPLESEAHDVRYQA